MSLGIAGTTGRRTTQAVFWFVILSSIGFVPYRTLELFPRPLELAVLAGALIAGGAAAFAVLQNPRLEPAAHRRQLLFARRLLTSSVPVLILLYAYRVTTVSYGKELRTVRIPIGLLPRNPACCEGLDDVVCIKEITLNDGAIQSCWGGASVASARLGLVLSYWGTALACGLWIGLLRIRKPYFPAPGRTEPSQSPASHDPPSSAAPIYDLFLSYASEDRPLVEALAADLQSRGLVLWWDQPEVKAGDSIVSTIEQGLLASRRFAVVLSPSARRSQWVTEETNAALAVEKERRERSSEARNPFVIPVLYLDCEVPVFLKDRRHVDFRSSYEQGLSELLRRLLPADGTAGAVSEAGVSSTRFHRSSSAQANCTYPCVFCREAPSRPALIAPMVSRTPT